MSGIIYLLNRGILLFTSQGVVSFDCCLLGVSGLVYFSLSFWLSVRYWVHCIDCSFTLALLGCYIRVSGCSINGILSGLSGVGHLLNRGILLFASEGVISLDCCFLSVSCLVYFGLSLRFRVRYWVDCCDGSFTLALFSRYICVICCCIDGVFGCLSGVGHLLDRSILLFTSEGVISFDGGLLSVSCFINFCLSLRFRVRYWVHCVNRCFTLALFGCHIGIGGCGIDRILGCLGGVIYLLDGCIFLFTSEGVVSFNRCLLSIGGFVDFGLSFWLSVSYWVDCCDGCLALALLGRYIGVVCCRIDGVLSGLCCVIYLLDGCILFFASEGIVCLDRCLLSIGGFVDFGLSFWLSVSYWVDCCDGCLALALLGRYIGVGCCGVDRILSGLGGVIYLLDGCILLFTSEGVISFDGGLLGVSCVLHRLLSCWLRIWCWVDVCDGLDASVFLCANLGSSRRGINGILSDLCSIIHLFNGCIFFFLS